MNKIYLSAFLTAALLVSSWGGHASAQEDVTSTYLKNADFEGDQQILSNSGVSPDRAIYEPAGWNLEYTDGDKNDMTILQFTDKASNNFNGIFANLDEATYGKKTYRIRYKWGNKEDIKLYQKVILPKGNYKLTANVAGNATNKLYLFAGDIKTTDGVNDSKWKDISLEFSSDGTEIQIGIDIPRGKDEQICGFDNFKLTTINAVVKTNLTNAITSAKNANKSLNNGTLATAIKTAQGVADNTSATQDEVDEAVKTLNNAVKTAATTDGANVTYYITNNSFETGDLTGWTYNSANDTKVAKNDDNTYKTTGCDGSYLFNTWGGTAEKYVKQELKNLPEGFYQLSALFATDANKTGTIYAGTSKVTASGDATGKGKFNTFTTPYIYVADGGSLEIGATSTNWYKVDNFQLTFFTKEEAAAGETEYSALNKAITDAQTHTLGFESGEYAPYNNVDAIKALTAAEAIDPTKINLKTTVTAATAALTSAKWTSNTSDVECVYNSNFSTVEDGQNYPKGWTRTNSWGQKRTDADKNSTSNGTAYYNQPGSLVYGKNTGYTLPLAANTVYKLTFKYASHENNSNTSMTASVLNSKNDGLAATKYPGNPTVGTTENSFVTRVAYFTTGAAGDYILTLANEGNTWITDVSLTKAVATDITLGETETSAPGENQYVNATLSRTFKQGWNSIILPFDVTTTELGASKAVEFSGTEGTTLYLTTVKGSLNANTPYMVYFDAANTSNIVFSGKLINTVSAGTVTDANSQYNFVGNYVVSETSPIAKGDYIVVPEGIQKAAGGNNLKAFRAYFKAVGATSAKSMTLSIDGETVTGIQAVELKKAIEDGAVYNIAGQRVNDNYKGIVIKNGKKLINK